MEKQTLRIGRAQFTPVWMDRRKTLEKALDNADAAAGEGCELAVLGAARAHPPQPRQVRKIAELARGIAAVAECHRVTGEDCFILKVHLPGLDHLDRILDRFLAHGTTTTSLIQSSPVPLRPPPLPEE